MKQKMLLIRPKFLRKIKKIVVYLTSSCVNWAFFGMSGPV
jgi:hypothetical protein